MRKVLRWLCVAIWVGLAAGPIHGTEDDRDREAPTDRRSDAVEPAERAAVENTAERVVYVPPARGAPRARTGGGTRGPGALPRLEVLAPDHVGRTTREAPTLAWFVSGRASVPLELTLLRDGASEPELEVRLANQVETGIGEASLSRWDVELEPGVVYQWSVALVVDPGRRDRDVVASGAIERVAEPAAVATARASGAPAYAALAREGIWYDALSELGSAIAAGDPGLRAERARLLDQVGLPDAAEFERTAR